MQIKELIDLLKKLPEGTDVYFGFKGDHIDPDNPGYSISSVLYLIEQNVQVVKAPVVVIRGE